MRTAYHINNFKQAGLGRDPIGHVTVKHTFKHKSGIILPFDPSFLAIENFKPEDTDKRNLIVSSGREVLAECLGGLYQTTGIDVPYINRITLGEGAKTGNLPNLSDTGLVQEIQKLDGTVAGTFLLDGPDSGTPDVTFPSPEVRWPLSGTYTGNNGAITIDASGDTILTDATVDFIATIGVELYDQVTFNNDLTNPLVMGVREVRSATELVLHNPTGYTNGAIGYNISSPGTQVLFSKTINGNDFPKADWGAAITITEAGLLFDNSTLFNRIIFGGTDEEKGLLLQSDETTGVESSIEIEWLVTF